MTTRLVPNAGPGSNAGRIPAPGARRSAWSWRALGFLAALALLAGGPQAQTESADDKAFLAELRAEFRRGGSWSALRDLREYLQEFPQSSEARALAAAAAWQRGDLAEAERHLNAAGDPDPSLLGRILLRTGRPEEALQLARGGAVSGLAARSQEVAALEALGHHVEALRVAHDATDGVDDRTLDGHGLVELGRLLLFQRRFEKANQALVFADADLNGRKGPGYRLVEPEALLLLAEVYVETRQTTTEGADPGLGLLDEILRLDPGQADALVLKARMHVYGMNGRAAEDALQKALSRDPTHPGALLLLGRTRLLDRRTGAAIELAGKVLGQDPFSRDGLALRAAALAVAGDPAAAAAREEFTRRHPESAALDGLLGEVLQSHYRFEESVPPLERALATEPDDESPLPILAQSLAHLGREQEAIAALEDHARRSPFVFPWRTNMLAVLGKLRQSTVIETERVPGFELRLPPGEQDVLGKLLEQRLLEARADMAARWGLDPGCRVLVEVFDRHGDFSVRTVGFEGFLALGACFGCVLTMLSPQCELRGQFVWPQTAVHEYAHVVTLGLSHQRVPRWLTEGISVVEEKKADPSWAREMERELLDARSNGMLLPVERLDEAFRDGSTVMLGYYQGSVVAEVIEHDFGFSKLRDFVAAFAEVGDTPANVRRVLGIGPEELDRRVLAWVDSVVAPTAAIRPDWNEDGKERLRHAAQSGDDGSWLDLAEAYLQLGRRSDADDALQRSLRARGETPETLAVLAERDLADGRAREARGKLERWAAEVARPDADRLTMLADLQQRDGDADAARASLERARSLFPGDMRPDGPTARLLRIAAEAGDEAQREELLRAIAAHDESALGARRELLELVLARGESAEAISLLRQALDIDPYLPDLRMRLADLLRDAGERDAARAEWGLVLGMRQGQEPGAGGRAGPHGMHAEPAAPPFVPKGEEPQTLEQWQARARARLAETAPGG